MTTGGTIPGEVYIGLDLGTSGLKAVALAATGAILARGSAVYATRRPAAGAAEQDTGDWQRAVQHVMTQIGEVIPARRWRAIGLSPGSIPAARPPRRPLPAPRTTCSPG